jgi:branched-chain amino acid transport system permease protein
MLLGLLLMILPWVAGEYWVSLLTQMFIFGLLALATDLLLGHAGLFSLCHAAFFSVAAYASAILQVRYGFSTLSGMAAGVALGTSLGLLFGLAVRTRGVYFILVTLAMGYVIWGVGYRWSALTGGDSGITNVPAPSVGGLSVQNGIEMYYVILLIVVLVLALYARVVASPFGLALRGIKSGWAFRRLNISMRPLCCRPCWPVWRAFCMCASTSL